MGSPRKTAAEKRQAGGRPKGIKRPPKLPAGRPKKPADLSLEASEAWDWLAGQLEATGVLTESDFGILRRYASAVEMRQKMAAEVDTHGLMYVHKSGYGKHPLITSIYGYDKLLLSILGECGLTPKMRPVLKNTTTKSAADDDNGWSSLKVHRPKTETA